MPSVCSRFATPAFGENPVTDHATTIRDLYAAFAAGDIASVLAPMAPDIAWTEAEGYPYAGTYHGPDAVLNGVFARTGAEWDGFAAVCDELVTEGDTVVALGHYSGTFKATGKSFRAPFVHVWKFAGDKVQRFIQHTDTVLVQRALQ